LEILLVNPPFILSEDSPYSKTGAVLPPLGLLYIASYLRHRHPEFNIHILDAPAFRLTLKDFEEKIRDYSPDVIGITVYTTTFSIVLETVKAIKKTFPESLVVCGGPHSSIMPDECLASPYIDVAVIGEGEEVFEELLECLRNKDNINKVSNIVYKSNGRIVKTGYAPKRINLDFIPIPARDLIDMNIYRPAKGTYKRLPATNMITSRGCPYNCNFCSKLIFGSKYRVQSPEKTVDEIESLIRDYGILEVIFSDDVFTVNKRRMEAFCDLLIQKQLDFTWSCSTRVNLVNPELLKNMKRSGCISIGFGIEAGDPAILKKIDKGFSLDKAKEAIKWTKDAGIETRAFYILGFPGETRDTLRKTIDTSIELDTDFVIYNIAIPMPGTAMFDEAKENNLLLYEGIELYNRTDGPHPLIRLHDVTPEELIQLYNTAYRKYYLRPKYIFNQLLKVRSVSDLSRYGEGFISFLKWFK
jgi:radical SAM superfamily enzyme YgiQ (UPF0313 family)